MPLPKTPCNHCRKLVTWREVRAAERRLIDAGTFTPGVILGLSPICKKCAGKKLAR